MRILIVEDGRGSYVLPAVRSFGAAGWEVALGGPRPSRAARSRHVARSHEIPAVEQDYDGFVAAVAGAVDRHRYDVVFGGDDVEVLALSAARDELRTCVPYAPHASVVRSVDKLLLTEAATAVGLAAPRTVEATAQAALVCPVPVMVKSRLHWTPGSVTGRGRLAAVHCESTATVQAALAEMTSAGSSAVLQEPIDGALLAVTSLCAPGGRVVAQSQQLASHLSPRWRTTTRGQTVPVDAELSDRVGALLAELGWLGIANLQFLVPVDGPPQLIDLNGRFYGSLALAMAAGLDLPVWWALLATGARVDPQPAARVGVRYQALEEDLARARAERRGGLAADVLDTLHFARGATHSTAHGDDPRPALTRAVTLGRQWLGHRLTRGATGSA